MTTTPKDKSKWLQVGLISLLAVAVIVLAGAVFKMQGQIETLNRSGAVVIGPAPQGPQIAQPGPRSTPPTKPPTPPTKPPKTTPFDLDDDGFSSPFDPDKWDPFAEMQRMQEHINRMFDNSFGHFGQSPKYRGLAKDPAFSPKIDMREEKDRFVIRLDLPGVDEGSLNVKVDGTKLTISGQKESSHSDADKSGRMMRQERRTGQFARTIELPEPVDAAKMEVKNEQGVFTIILPKAPSTKAIL